MRTFLIVLMLLAVGSAGCIRTGHHVTVDETKFPPGAIYDREEDKGVGVEHHAYVIHIYPAGTNATQLEEGFLDSLYKVGWMLNERGNVSVDRATPITFFDLQKGGEFLSCETGREMPTPKGEEGIALLCRFGSKAFTYRPNTW